MTETYHIETADQTVRTSVRVRRSLQHDPYSRILTVSPRALARLERLASGATWYVGAPTPYRPRAVFVTA